MTKKFILLIIFTFFSTILLAENNRYYSFDKGLVSLIYHRFNESKYPSTNIQMDIFIKQISIINENNYNYYNPKNFDIFFNNSDKKKKILITIDDAFSSFYENAWPYLKENKIPFILFVSTEPIGKYGYMNWDQVKEIEKEDFAFIGNHSHSHEYLVDYEFNDFKKDIDQSIEIFKKKLGYNPIFFSYPFGEYSLEQKNYVKQKFKYAFGQHSGVIDLTKDKFELPRFPINEKYGDLKRFKFLVDFLPFQYQSLFPEEKFIKVDNNPPEMIVNFFPDQKNLNNINCFSNEGNIWKKTEMKLYEKKLVIKFNEKFFPRRGRINCSLNDNEGWRWFGVQFTID
ncbi:MAG: polysaccharide deacetylase family protein, partial [Pelagibacterales bacterium]|nr:polysaccharide deacetylase family protein [Pelagibacterales bacterium]